MSQHTQKRLVIQCFATTAHSLFAIVHHAIVQGPAYQLASPVPKPGYPLDSNTNTTYLVNIYVSQV